MLVGGHGTVPNPHLFHASFDTDYKGPGSLAMCVVCSAFERSTCDVRVCAFLCLPHIAAPCTTGGWWFLVLRCRGDPLWSLRRSCVNQQLSRLAPFRCTPIIQPNRVYPCSARAGSALCHHRRRHGLTINTHVARFCRALFLHRAPLETRFMKFCFLLFGHSSRLMYNGKPQDIYSETNKTPNAISTAPIQSTKVSFHHGQYEGFAPRREKKASETAPNKLHVNSLRSALTPAKSSTHDSRKSSSTCESAFARLYVVEVSLDLQIFVNVFPAQALLLHHPALDTPCVVRPAVYAVLAHLTATPFLHLTFYHDR